jgi:sulfonate transport system substrate-binding protein
MTAMSHRQASSSRRRALVTGVAALATLARPAARAQSSGAAPVAQVRIGFQKSAVNLVVLKQQGALERRFAGSKVQWLEFPAGPQLLEALSVGSLEFGLTGDSPPVFAQAAGRELFYVGAEPPKPLSSAVLALQGSPLRNLRDLKGKRIALQKGSSSHYLLVRAVEKAGLAWSDIAPIYLAPSDARAAFEKGAVDAWVVWDPYYAATELDIKPVVIATGTGLSNNNSFYLASKPFVQEHAGAVQALLAELTRADAYVQSNRKEAAQLISDFSGLSLATVHLFLSRRPPSPVAPLGAALVADQQRVADAFLQQGLIPRAVKVADIVWSPARARDLQAKAA